MVILWFFVLGIMKNLIFIGGISVKVSLKYVYERRSVFANNWGVDLDLGLWWALKRALVNLD